MKQFLCTWGEGYVRQESRVLGFDDINEENGWFEENIERLENAHIGEVVNCSDISGLLYVKRIS